MPFEPIIPDGQRLGNSHTEAGAVTGHLFNIATGELEGHASWRWVDEPTPAEPSVGGGGSAPSDDDAAAEVALLIVAGIVAAAIIAKPALQRWWNGKVRLIASSLWNKLTSGLSQHESSAIGHSHRAPDGPQPVTGEIGADLVGTDTSFAMSIAEWTTRFQAMLAANESLNEELSTLAHARILVEDVALPETGRNESLTARQFAERVKIALMETPILLDDRTATALVRTFGTPIELARAESRRQLE